ncbi:hypothetical protein BS638_09100 [Clostridium tepidum]|uniref:Uncharacterized protein n=1 Tax=Clostridium tepidum TaxID=1962263 RepID=A0A1S9I4A2_9CLOT|nr:hypothetical protein BS637_04850 [Clostridium tepidum]OOO65058.1 hypothetical protein BS638_09100 [Clostridium tepidum]
MSKSWITFLQFAFSFVIYRLIMKFFNFNYNLFSDKFNIIKLFIYLGLWLIIYLMICCIF